MIASIINRNIVRLGQKFTSQVNYRDIDYRGYLGKDSNGVDISPTITMGAVLVNDLKLWLISTVGDYYRRIEMGGFFDDIRSFPLTDDGAEDLKIRLTTAMDSNFPQIEVISATVIPDTSNKGWKINLVVKDRVTGIIAMLDSLLDTE